MLPAAVGALALAGCGPGPDTGAWTPRGPAADTVVVVTIDSVNARIMLEETWDWDVTPTLDAFDDEAVRFTHLLTPRGLTQVALSSMLTGLYPVNHGVRGNEFATDGMRALRLPSLLRRFQAAGYRTYGFSANQCPLIAAYVDEATCTWQGEIGGDWSGEERDRMLVDALVETLADTPSDERMFLWLHLNNVHHPYVATGAYRDTFHPEPYEGTLDPQDDQELEAITLGERGYDETDRAWTEAAYASQLRQDDDEIARVFQALRDLGRWDDAVVAVGVDHGDELASHASYFWHGCSPYDSVLRVSWAFRSPLLPAGVRHDDWVSMVDVAPTVVDLAGAFPWDGALDGRSLVDPVITGAIDSVPVYFERTLETAGMVRDGYRVVVSGSPGFDTCEPFDAAPGAWYPGETLELYDLDADPDDQVNLASARPDLAARFREDVCRWVTDGPWLEGADGGQARLYPACETVVWLSR